MDHTRRLWAPNLNPTHTQLQEDQENIRYREAQALDVMKYSGRLVIVAAAVLGTALAALLTRSRAGSDETEDRIDPRAAHHAEV